MAPWISPWAARRVSSCSRIYPRAPTSSGDPHDDANGHFAISLVRTCLRSPCSIRLAGLWPRQGSATILAAHADQYGKRLEARSRVDVLHGTGKRAPPPEPIHSAGGQWRDVSLLALQSCGCDRVGNGQDHLGI